MHTPELGDRAAGLHALGDVAEAYAFGTLGKGYGIADINWRNPAANPTVFNTAPAIFPGYNLLSVFPAGFTPLF